MIISKLKYEISVINLILYMCYPKKKRTSLETLFYIDRGDMMIDDLLG